MNTSTPRILSGAEVRALSTRSDWLGGLQVGLHVAAIVVAAWLVAMSGPWTVVLLSLSQSALFAPIHETMHLTAFRSRRANAVIGWLAACPSMLNWHFYTVFHLAHHRFTQDPERDPELTPPPPAALDSYLLRCSQSITGGRAPRWWWIADGATCLPTRMCPRPRNAG